MEDSPEEQGDQAVQPNPFWSEEVQRQYMEAIQSEEAVRPADLVRYETQSLQQDDQQVLEPPYGQTGTAPSTVGLDHAAQQLLEVSSGTSSLERRGRNVAAGKRTAALSRMEPRTEVSPDRLSTGNSELSALTAASKAEAELQRREPSEPELLPERSLVEAKPVGDAASLMPAQPIFPIEQVLQQMGSMVQQALREQVTPKLQEMMAQQSMVSIRLDQLERASRSASLDGELLAERASLLDLSGPQPSEPPRTEAVAAVGSANRSQLVERSVHTTAQEQIVRARYTPNPEEGKLQTPGVKSEAWSSGGDGNPTPTQGTVWMDTPGRSMLVD